MENRWIGIMLVSFLMFAPVNAFAQMKGGGGEKKEVMEKGMMGSGGMGMQSMEMMEGHGTGMGHDMMGLMWAMSQLDLTLEQKKNIQQLKLKHQKEAIPLLGKIQMAGVELKETLLEDPIDMGKVKEKIKEKHETMAELEASHLLLAQQIKAQLNPEQRQKIESMMEMKPQMDMMGADKGKKPSRKGSEKPEGSPKTDDSHGE
ncbi:MAG: Spy/CpxP family protein refolding chaperone [Nitrospiria bacterium]